jgi:hypothetical protein
MHKRIGQILFELQVVNNIELKELLVRQEKENMRLGQLAIHLGFASEADIMLALEIQIGEILVDRDVITREQCDEVITAFRERGARIGALLIHNDYAPEDEVMDAYRYQAVSEFD